MNFATLQDLCLANGLQVLGGLSVEPSEELLKGYKTLILLGPDEPRFWDLFKDSAEFGMPLSPLDAWSKRVINGLASELEAKAFFPSDGPPYAPFFTWALKTGRCHSSPVNLLVHDRAGMMISFRGALALRTLVELPPAPPSPCISCINKPCLTSCPVQALTPDGYDVPKCKSHIKSERGENCMQGCKVRRACPVSQKFGRLPEQSQFHMKAFVGPEDL